MPSYVLKVTDKDGWESPPIVANCSNEDEAVRLVRLVTGDDDTVECKGIRSNVMKVAFGNVPEGAAVFRHDWAWADDGKTPRPY